MRPGAVIVGATTDAAPSGPTGGSRQHQRRARHPLDQREPEGEGADRSSHGGSGGISIVRGLPQPPEHHLGPGDCPGSVRQDQREEGHSDVEGGLRADQQVGEVVGTQLNIGRRSTYKTTNDLVFW